MKLLQEIIEKDNYPYWHTIAAKCKRENWQNIRAAACFLHCLAFLWKRVQKADGEGQQHLIDGSWLAPGRHHLFCFAFYCCSSLWTSRKVMILYEVSRESLSILWSVLLYEFSFFPLFLHFHLIYNCCFLLQSSCQSTTTLVIWTAVALNKL